VQTGLMTLPMATMNCALAPVSGRLVASVGPRRPLIGAAAFILAAALVMTTFTASTSLVVVVIAYLLLGTGFGLVNAPITNTAVSGMPRTQAGVAAAVASTSRQVGSSLGVAIFGSILASGGTFAHASHICWWLAAGCAVAIGALGVLTTGRAAKASAVRTAAIFKTADADTRVTVGQAS
jgi:MFS family permease